MTSALLRGHSTPLRRPALAALATVVAVAAGVGGQSPATASTPFHVGVPTIVDPVRGGGEPYISVGNANDPWISAPAGTSTQTSWFYRSRDQGQSFPLVGQSGGHWVCNAGAGNVPSGGGDSHILIDRPTGNVYVVDQEALASLGFGKTDPKGQNLTSNCVAAPDVSADRPFVTLMHPGTSPQSGRLPGQTISYLSFLCAACNPGGAGPGTLVFGWSTDGVTYHGADPGSLADTPIFNTLTANSKIGSFGGHGTMYADPANGYVYTALSCSGSCPDGTTQNQFGLVVGVPDTSASPSNAGAFSDETYTPAAIDGVNGVKITEGGILFPILTVDSAGTMYLAWVSGSGTATTGTPPADSLHVTYVYNKNRAGHYPKADWSAPHVIDQAPTQAAAFPWIVAGDPGKLGAVWMGANKRQYPSQLDATKTWSPYMAISTNADTTSPSWMQEKVGVGDNHLSDVCLQGTVGCALVCIPTQNPCVHGGNRNMADFISVDAAPDGSLEMTWASDANQLATNPDTGQPGLPLTEFAKQTSGPKLVGSGDVVDSRFSTVPQAAGVTDPTGDAIYDPTADRVDQGQNYAHLDLTGSHLAFDGTNLLVYIPVANLTGGYASPSTSKSHVWWMTTWQYKDKIYFAKADSSGGAAPTFSAGLPSSYDRPGLGATTSATLVDYSGGTAVTGIQQGNQWVITVPASVVGSPTASSLLEAVTAFTVLDNGQPPVISVGLNNTPTDNVPIVVDAAPAYDFIPNQAIVPPGTGQNAGGSTGTGTTPNTSAATVSPLAALAALCILGCILFLARARRRGRSG